MTKEMKRSSKSDIRKYLFIIVGISLICLLVLFLKQNRTIKRNFGDIAPVTGKYQEVYYKRSVYKDKTFAKIFADYDSESGDCLTRLLLTGTDVTDTSDPYSGDVPPNIIFDMNMTTAEYDEMIGRYPLVELSKMTVTTMSVPTGKNGNGPAYMYTYAERGDATPIKKLATRTLNDVNDGLESEPVSVSGTRFYLQGNELRHYFNKYNFHHISR